MAEITVKSDKHPTGWQFQVQIQEGTAQTNHKVTMTDATFKKLSAGKNISPEALVEKSFRFLLEREPKESIMSQFDITVISRYFPEYEKTITSN